MLFRAVRSSAPGSASSAPPIIARMSDSGAPFISFPPVEQVAVLARLRAQILLRRLHLAPESRRPHATASAGRRGSPRASATMSASPVPTIASACSNSVIRPDGDDRHVDGALHRAGERHLVARADGNLLRAGRGRRSRRGSRRSRAPRAPARTRWSARCPSRPRPNRSPETRIVTGRSAGNAARTASNTSSGKRMRFSRLPPYSSVRRFESGERNWCSR